jgi:hypothetical protein
LARILSVFAQTRRTPSSAPGDLPARIRQDRAMPTDDENPNKQPDPNSAVEWLGKRAGLLILVVIGAIVGLRLMSSWIKWMLIAVVVAAIVYLVKSAQRSEG